MIEITYYEKRTIKLRPAQLLDLDDKVRRELGVAYNENLLIHDLLIHGRKHGLGIRLPKPEDMEPDDDCGPAPESYHGYTRGQLLAWVEEKRREHDEEMKDVPDIFDDLDDDRKECKVCQAPLEAGECPNRKCGNSPLFIQE